MTRTIYGLNLTKFVPLNSWFRWWMLRHFLESGVSARTLMRRLGWSSYKLRRIFFSINYSLKIDDLAVWFFAIDGRLLDFKLVDRGME